ncbi:MAG TPA: hypothetical protein VG247_21095 [Pseudonocardiaceae bacterium]|jgi:hypothetical protein|nr:hypothetical protein [Pseudonocardiaceae bacterium]
MSSSFAMRFSAVAGSALAVLAIVLGIALGSTATHVSRHADDGTGSSQTTTTDPTDDPNGHGWID